MDREVKILLDTCALIWWTLDPEQLSPQSVELIEGNQLLLSTVSIWEIGIKIKNKKLDIGMSIQEYLDKLKILKTIEFIPVDEVIWVKNLMLNWSHKDPADRTIVATALLQDAFLITKDENIINFYPKTISCNGDNR
jgi:PIN domain nuclease of toxin-antitoxin system